MIKKFTSFINERYMRHFSDNNLQSEAEIENVDISNMDNDELIDILSNYIGNEIIFTSNSYTSKGDEIGPLELKSFYLESDDGDNENVIVLEMSNGFEYELDRNKTIEVYFN